MTTFIIVFIILIGLYAGYFALNRVDQPYSDWQRVDFQERLLIQCREINADRWLFDLVKFSCDDVAWDPEIEFDGCSIIQDYRIPCLPCYVHDWMCKTGQGGALADKIFYRLLLITGRKKWKAKVMYVLVRIGWGTFLRRKHQKERNLNAYCDVVIGAAKILNLKVK